MPATPDPTRGRASGRHGSAGGPATCPAAHARTAAARHLAILSGTRPSRPARRHPGPTSHAGPRRARGRAFSLSGPRRGRPRRAARRASAPGAAALPGGGAAVIHNKTTDEPDRNRSRAMESPAVNVNGRVLAMDGVTPHLTALDWLREQGLTGCKEGCAEGECGACSIMVARSGVRTATEWTALNACLVPIAALGRPGARDGRGARHVGRPASRAVGDGGARRVAVRLLHAGVRLQHGGRVLPAGPGNRGRGARPTTSTARTGSTSTR